MLKFGDLGSKFSKTSVRLEITTFEIGHRQNFVIITKLIFFYPKYPYLEIWAQGFRKTMSDFK